jgi:hypothetical protein
MNICITNHFETNVKSDIYISILNCARPLIRPASLEEESLSYIYTDLGVYEQTKQSCKLTTSCNLDYKVKFSSFESLRENLLLGFREPLPLYICAVKYPDYTYGIWVFRNQGLIGYLPLGFATSIIFSEQTLPLVVTVSDLLQKFLTDYIRILRKEKTRFRMTNLNKNEFTAAALIRKFSDDHLIYGEAESRDQIKVLKTLKFLTHDLPKSKTVHLNDLYQLFESVLSKQEIQDLQTPRNLVLLENL